MKFKCPNCKAPFDDMGLSKFSDHEITCPNCKIVFQPQLQHSIRANNYSDDDFVKDWIEMISDKSWEKVGGSILRTAIANLFTLGCYLQLIGKKEAGLKATSSALNALYNIVPKPSTERILKKIGNDINGNEERYSKLLRPHHEIISLIYDIEKFNSDN